MKKSSVGKKAIASACALTLALSMPVLAFAGDPDGAAQGDGIMVAADEPSATINGTTNEVTSTIEGDNSGVSVLPANNEELGVSDNLNVTVNYVSDGFANQDALNEAIAENGPVIEEVTAPSAAFEEVLNGSDDFVLKNGGDSNFDKDAAKDLISSEDNYISKNTYELNASGLKTDEAVTVVYAVDANAEGVSCYAYYTVTDGAGNKQTVVEKLPVTDGVATLTLGDNMNAGTITFVLANENTAVQPADATTNVSKGGNATDGYELVYTTGATKAMLGNGQLNWSAQATADVHQAAETANAGNLAISADVVANNASDAYKADQLNNPFDYAKFFNVTVTSAANAEDITNPAITANVGAANRMVRVYYTETVDGKPVGKYRDLTSDADGNVTMTGVVPDTVYTFAVAPAGQTPDNPNVPDIPVNPDQPVNPDNPTPVVPGDEGSDNGVADNGNSATAADKGTTSPKTGIF